ncbi:hypothetical protein CAPTEDRAFT_205101 [Capitella teleta]|uniref:Uncharacterized protein n=1 Tax=Capitella teleta TaxID=283909 RepID=R7TT12_CAPTE|nr:hypothetical protein CAPTEDRAFT_205101 [Capitella teleta]|eukprot:ELT96774.1 hypothetical protein CAPTEDRAFT_205101 [Capitella teleta]
MGDLRCFVQNEFHADESDEENQSEEDQSDESCKKEVESRNDKGAARFQWTEKLTLIIKNAFSSCINAPTGSRLPSKMKVLGFMNKHQLVALYPKIRTKNHESAAIEKEEVDVLILFSLL